MDNCCKIFLGSPSDTYEERRTIREVVDILNKTIGPAYDITIKLLTWEDSTYPAVATYPQEAINEQIGNDYTIFIGIMWKAFGSQTQKAGSGTEEEFNNAYENYVSGGSCKNIMFYFNQAPLPQDTDFVQFAKVQAFKSKISENGVYYGTYDGLEDFKRKITCDLSACINSLYKAAPAKESETVLPLAISESFNDYLEAVGTDFTHPESDAIRLSDIYIPLNIRSFEGKQKNQNIDLLTDALENEAIKYLFVGADSSGKTSLCKYLFRKYFSINLTPILVSGEDFNTNVRQDNIIRTIINKFKEQYSSYSVLPTNNIENNDVFIIIVDDFQKSAKANSKYWNLLTNSLSKLFHNTILVADNSVPLVEISNQPVFKGYNKYELLSLSSSQRNDLIKKWFALGRDGEVAEDKNDIFTLCDEANNHINSILGKNYIPATPFYVLGMLQAIETTKSSASNYSLYGFYYEKIINDCFEASGTDYKDSSFYYGLLSEYCFELFKAKTKFVLVGEFEEFYRNYCSVHAVDTKRHTFETLTKVLGKSKLLRFDTHVHVSQKYVYYFFVAKYIANNLENSDIQNIVSNLIARSFRNEYFNILMFLTHLSKSEWVVRELIASANSIFCDYKPARLESDLDKINSLITDIPQKIVGIIDVEKEREKQLEIDEQIEKQQEEFERDVINYDAFDISDDVSSLDLLARLNLALKTIDLLGEVAKKYWGELKADIKYELVLSAYNLGLRSLSVNLDVINRGETEIVDYIKQQIREKYIREQQFWNADLNKDTVTKVSNAFIINLAFLASWGAIRRVSSSVGYDKLNLTYDEILKNHPNFSYKLIDLSIDLNYKNIPLEEVEGYEQEMKSNNMCYLLLRELVINHLYMFEESYKVRDRIFQLFDIKQSQQKYITGSSFEKRNK